jgi:hypothetical protein
MDKKNFNSLKMEAETIQKNAASPKSQTSRGNFSDKMKVNSLSILMFLAAFLYVNTAMTGNVAAAEDQSCTVTVKYSNGALAKSVTVSTEVSGGVSCIGGRDFETNKDGVATLKWVKGCYLKKVYVKGDSYKVDYADGKSYTLILK